MFNQSPQLVLCCFFAGLAEMDCYRVRGGANPLTELNRLGMGRFPLRYRLIGFNGLLGVGSTWFCNCGSVSYAVDADYTALLSESALPRCTFGTTLGMNFFDIVCSEKLPL